MNKKIALCLSLLKGDIINVSNSIRVCGYSNPAREIPREVEKPFGIVVSRVRRKAKDQFGNPVTWMDYRLNISLEQNKEGLVKLKAFVRDHLPASNEGRTPAEQKIFRQQELFIKSL